MSYKYVSKAFHFAMWRLTCQHISHDDIPEKRDAVNNVPESLEVGEDVVDGVG